MVGTCLGALDLFKARAGRHVDLTANDGLDARFFTGFVKLHYAVHRAVIGNGDRVMSALGGTHGNIPHATSAVKQAVFAVQMQMDEFVLHENSFLRRCRNFFDMDRRSQLFLCRSIGQLCRQIDQLLQAVIQPRFGDRRHVRLGKLAKRRIGIAQAQHGGIL